MGAVKWTSGTVSAQAGRVKMAQLRFVRYCCRSSCSRPSLRRVGCPTDGGSADQHAAEPVSDDRQPLQDARRACLGCDERVEIDKDGRSIWVGERCGANSCLDPNTRQMSRLPPILKFDAAGTLVEASVRPARVSAWHPCGPRRQHLGDRRQDDATSPRSSRPGQPGGTASERPKPWRDQGHQVFKFSPRGSSC